jgi:hypothetical protein
MEQDDIDAMEDFLTSEGLNLWHCVDMTDEAEFELPPSFHPELLAGGYATFVFCAVMTSQEAHAEALNLRYATTLRQINHQPPAGSRKAANGALLSILTRGQR